MLRLQAPLPDDYRNASDEDLAERIRVAKAALGSQLFILGHHYQRDEVMVWADARGDSFKLAQMAKGRPDAAYIVFCGVHFMAESADILTSDDQAVILPDLNAGCSMADMADLDQVEEAWETLERMIDIDRVVPVTYMNSSAALKAFVGEHGGAVCTSSNARAVLDWAFERGDKTLFFPDQHLGRNTGYEMGYDESDMRVWNPRLDAGGLTEADAKEARFLLWKGHCSVHQRFRPEHVETFRAEHPGAIVVVHPECAHETVASGRRGRLDRGDHPHHRRRPRGRGDRRGHRDPPDQPPQRRDPGQDRRSPSIRWSAPARPCSASTAPTWPGSSRTWSRATS